METGRTTLSVQRYLDELSGSTSGPVSEEVVRTLLTRSANRLHMLCRTVLHNKYPRLLDGPSNLRSEELLGGVTERLIKALRTIRPETTRQFFALAFTHLRWELNEVSRRLDAKIRELELGENHVARKSPNEDPAPSARLERILDAIDQLPEEEREAFNLIRVQGVTVAEAAEITGASVSTVKRRVNRSIASLAEMLPECIPSWAANEYSGLDAAAVNTDSYSRKRP